MGHSSTFDSGGSSVSIFTYKSSLSGNEKSNIFIVWMAGLSASAVVNLECVRRVSGIDSRDNYGGIIKQNMPIGAPSTTGQVEAL